jgi:hypothetical protein
MKLALVLSLFATAAWAQVEISQDGDKVHVRIAGQPFTDFVMRGGEAQKPYLWPLRTASGVEVTRHWPMVDTAGEPHDHPHQRGLWFAHDEVNGVDFWNNEASYKAPPPRGKITVDSVKFKGGDKSGTINATLSWKDPDGKKLLDETRVMTFSGTATLRIVDFDITLTAATHVAFGDSKDGVFGVRLLPALQENKVIKERGKPDAMLPGTPGTIVNADGLIHEKDAWGKTSNWVDYCGDPGDGKIVGIAILDHPSNSTRAHWHVRGYGLFAANPFGNKTFVDAKSKEESVTLDPGKSLHYRYRVVIHSGDTQSAGIAQVWDEFIRK